MSRIFRASSAERASWRTRPTRASTSVIRAARRSVSRLMAVLLLQTGKEWRQLVPDTPCLCLTAVGLQPALTLRLSHGLTAAPKPGLTFGPDALLPRAPQQAEASVFATTALKM